MITDSSMADKGTKNNWYNKNKKDASVEAPFGLSVTVELFH